MEHQDLVYFNAILSRFVRNDNTLGRFKQIKSHKGSNTLQDQRYMIGGTISKMVGGSLQIGRVSAAFTHLFNAETKKLLGKYKSYHAAARAGLKAISGKESSGRFEFCGGIYKYGDGRMESLA